MKEGKTRTNNAEAEVKSEVKSAPSWYSIMSANQHNGFSASYTDGRPKTYRKLGWCQMSNMLKTD